MKKLYIGIAVVAVLVAAVGAVGIVSADEIEPPFVREGECGPRGQNDGPLQDLFLENVAEALGTTTDDLQSRIESGEKLDEILADYGYEGEAVRELLSSAREAAVAEALATGLITEEQAEKAFQPRGKEKGKGGPGGNILQEYVMNNVAEALGMTVDEMKSLRVEGEPLEVPGYSQEEIREIFEQAKEDAIEQALADGVITEEQLEEFENRHQNRPDGAPDSSSGSFAPTDGQQADG